MTGMLAPAASPAQQQPRGPMRSGSPRERAPHADDLGVTTVEYVIVLALVTGVLVAPMVALGVALLQLFTYQQALLLFPAP